MTVSLVLLMCNLAWADTAIVPIENSEAQVRQGQTIVLILLDGSRWDLLRTNDVPHLRQLAQQGVQGEMIPVWPTMSSPNHWALVTGLYPVHGGTFANSRYDQARKSYVDIFDDTTLRGEPIWATVVREGGISGVIGHWVGVQDASRRPSFFIPYDNDCIQCADLVLNLLDQPQTTRPRFLAVYTIQPDHMEHFHGVSSPEARAAIGKLDTMIGAILDGLTRRGLSDRVNIIVVADHGQRSQVHDTLYYLDQLIDMDSLETTPRILAGGTPLVDLWPKSGQEDRVYRRLEGVGPHLHVFRGHDLPQRWHCCDPSVVPPLVLLTDPGWAISLTDAKPPMVFGAHGYDNAVRDMHALFVAGGPAFVHGKRIEPFENIHLYSLMAAILGLQPAQSDGDIQPFCAALAAPPSQCSTGPGSVSRQ